MISNFDDSEGLLAHREEYILEIDADPRTNPERVAQAPGLEHRFPRVRGPRRVAQELAEGVMHTYEEGDLSETLIRCLQDPQSSFHKQ